jgi:hypothetical protein
LSGVGPEAAHYAVAGFIRFAQGEYREVVRVADEAMIELARDDPLPALSTAFAILREHALVLEESREQPEPFLEFSAGDADLLAKPVPSTKKAVDRFEVSLENALLLLYAAGWNRSAADRPLLLGAQTFALKLCAP